MAGFGVPDDTVPFAGEEVARIREAIRTEGAKLLCPRCGRLLTSDLPRGGRCGREEVWELHCTACHRSIVVEDSLHA